MFEVILRPVAAFKTWVAAQFTAAATEGAEAGIARWADSFSARLAAAPGSAPPQLAADAAPQLAPPADLDAEPVKMTAKLLDLAIAMIEKQGISQREAARRIKVPEATLRNWLLKREAGLV